MSIQFYCTEEDFKTIEPALKNISGVVSLAALPTKKGRSVFVKLDSEDIIEVTKPKIGEIKGVVFPDPNKTREKLVKAAKADDGSQAIAAALFTYETKPPAAAAAAAPQQQGQRTQNKQRGGRGGRGSNSNNGNRKGGDAQQQQQEGGQQPQRRRNNHKQRFPMIQGHVAVIDNVPFSTTNNQIAEAFVGCGMIYDINRLENMAMVYFDSAEAVQRAILALNGKSVQANTVTVSSGGVVKVPARNYE